jgi:hypothetical protein
MVIRKSILMGKTNFLCCLSGWLFIQGPYIPCWESSETIHYSCDRFYPDLVHIPVSDGIAGDL